jgi:hypothetical protein
MHRHFVARTNERSASPPLKWDLKLLAGERLSASGWLKYDESEAV